MEALTARQQEILDFIRTFVEDEGFPPTRADICRAMGFASPNAAETHLRMLERKGAIEMLEGASRGIRVMEESGMPIVGRVAAGSPILAAENVEARIPLGPSMFRPRASYLLRVRGLSMKDAGILDGDLLAVHKTAEARAGQIVVARLGDDVTVKRYQPRRGAIELVAENPAFKTIVVNPRSEPFAIEGIAVGVIRNDL
jgi:repressor LexA